MNLLFIAIKQQTSRFNYLHNKLELTKEEQEEYQELMMITKELLKISKRISNGGYINKHGVRVPNPCQEVDMKGRDLDRVSRNIRPGQKWDDETIDAILADINNV